MAHLATVHHALLVQPTTSVVTTTGALELLSTLLPCLLKTIGFDRSNCIFPWSPFLVFFSWSIKPKIDNIFHITIFIFRYSSTFSFVFSHIILNLILECPIPTFKCLPLLSFKYFLSPTPPYSFTTICNSIVNRTFWASFLLHANYFCVMGQPKNCNHRWTRHRTCIFHIRLYKNQTNKRSFFYPHFPCDLKSPLHTYTDSGNRFLNDFFVDSYLTFKYFRQEIHGLWR